MTSHLCYSLRLIYVLFFIHFSDHWWQNPTPSLAFLESVKYAVDIARISYSHSLPGVLSALHLKMPHHMGNFLCKIKMQSLKATASNNVELLLKEVPELKPECVDQQIGPHCQVACITVTWLKNSSESLQDITITNEMVKEIGKYKNVTSVTWQNLPELWPRLFPYHNWAPEKGRVRQRFVELPKTRERKRIEIWLNG